MKIQLRQFFYLPNLLSLSRIVLAIPLFYLIGHTTPQNYPYMLALAVITALTDTLDGLLSRKLNLITELGIMLDPLADKISIALIALALIMYRGFPIPLVALLLYRDLLIIVVGWLIVQRLGHPVMPNWWGKANTTVVAILGFLTLVGIPVYYLNILILINYFTLTVSAVSYAIKAVAYLDLKGKSLVFYSLMLIILTGLVIYLTGPFSFFMAVP